METLGYGINSHGEIVGVYIDANGVSHGFMDQSGVLTSIDYPAAEWTEIYGINDEGLIVGWAQMYPGPEPAAWYCLGPVSLALVFLYAASSSFKQVRASST
jgi:hypothetical protein